MTHRIFKKKSLNLKKNNLKNQRRQDKGKGFLTEECQLGGGAVAHLVAQSVERPTIGFSSGHDLKVFVMGPFKIYSLSSFQV